MKLYFLFLILLTGTLSACRQADPPPAFDTLDFTFFSTRIDNYSIRFTAGDTVYLRQYEMPDHRNHLSSFTNYVGVIPAARRKQLDSLFQHVDLLQYHHLDPNDADDTPRYAFLLKKGEKNVLLRVTETEPPAEITYLMNWMLKTKNELILRKSDTTLTFEGVKGIILYSPPMPPEMKFHR